LAHVGTFIEAVGQCCDRFGSLDRYTIDKLSGGSGSKGDEGLGDVVDGKLSCPAVIDNHDLPKAILGVAPPLQDGFAVEGDFATGFVKKTLQPALHRMARKRRLLTRPGSQCARRASGEIF
jgi:hypothetical protein